MSNYPILPKTIKCHRKHLEYGQTLEKLNPLKTQIQDIGLSNMTVSSNMLELLQKQTPKSNANESVMQESHLLTKNKILKDKSIILNTNSQITKSSKISGQDLIGKGKVCKPFWNSSLKDISNKLWLPTLTDCQDLDLNYFNGFVKNLTVPSWYSTRVQKPIQKLNYPKMCYPLLPILQPKITGCELPKTEKIEILKSKKIKLYPTTHQKKILSYWFGSNRWVYNQCNNYIKQQRKKGNNRIPSRKMLRDLFVSGKSKKIYSNGTPYDIRDGGMIDVLKNLKSNLSKLKKKSITHFDLKFKKLTNTTQSFSVPSKHYNRKRGDFTILKEIRKSENILGSQVNHDFRILKDTNGQYWMCLPVKKSFNNKRHVMKENKNSKDNVISLDPGVRTFLVGYDPNRKNIIHIGESAMKRIQFYCTRLDFLITKQSTSKNRKKVRLRKAIRKIRLKIKNSIRDMHYKTANFLCENYETILLPNFETQQMLSKLHSKVARNMQTLSHYSFKMRLLNKCNDYKPYKTCNVVIVTEEYTSKTCGKCGNINKQLGSSKDFICPVSDCQLEIDRDCNGARNILIKNM